MSKVIKVGTVVVGAALLAACGQDAKTEKAETQVKDVEVLNVEKNVEVVKSVSNDKVVSNDNKIDSISDIAESQEPLFTAIEGEHYVVIDDALEVDSFEGTTISEFFWLGCPHCQNFEPLVKKWKDSINEESPARVVKTAVAGSQRWNLDASVFHAIKELGGTETQVSLMLKLYEAERVKNNSLPDQADLASFFETLGFDKVKAMEILNDKTRLEPLLAEGNSEYLKTKANGVPVFVINGKYKVVFDNMKSDEQVVETIKQLGKMK